MEEKQSAPVTETDFTDDEEYSYSGYDELTEEARSDSRKAQYIDSGEEFSYTGYASESVADGNAQFLVGGDDERAHGELAVSDIGSYGDFIVEEFSVETNVKKLTRITKAPEKVIKYIFAVLYLAVGALCVAIPHGIEHSLPYIVGGGMAAYALVQLVFAIVQKEYRKINSNRTASALIIAGLSVMIMLEHEWAHTFIPIVWGILGLCEGAHAFNHAISRISRGMRPAYYIIKGIIEVVVAFLLLYKPEEYGELHIIVFGVSLIIDGITVMPIVNKSLTRQ